MKTVDVNNIILHSFCLSPKTDKGRKARDDLHVVKHQLCSVICVLAVTQITTFPHTSSANCAQNKHVSKECPRSSSLTTNKKSQLD